MKKQIAFCVILLALLVSRSAAVGPRLAVPAADEQAKLRHIVQDQFADLYASAARADQISLCKQLLQGSNESALTSAQQFVLLCEARDVAARGGDLGAAFRICDTLAGKFELTPAGARVGAITVAADNVSSLDSQEDFFRTLLTCVDQAMLADDFEPARRIMEIGTAAATTLQAVAWDQPLETRRSDLEVQSRAFAALVPALEKLRKDPADLPSKLLLAKYDCFIKGDWKTGMPLLEIADDELLHKQSRIEMHESMNDTTERREGRANGKLQLSIADGWDNIEKTLPPEFALQLHLHEYDWYLRALVRLPDNAWEDRTHVQAQLQKLVPLVDSHRPHAALWVAIADSLALKTARSTAVVGGSPAMEQFKDVPEYGGLLIGFHYSLAMQNGQKVITCLQPIYLTPTGEAGGALFGKQYSKMQTVRAPIGYAIGAIRVSGDDCLNSITPAFVRIEKDHLNPADALKTVRIGSEVGPAFVLDGHGTPIIGICGKQRDGYLGLGVVYSRLMK